MRPTQTESTPTESTRTTLTESQSESPLRAVGLMLLASASFAVMGALVKWACRDLSSLLVVLARSVVVVAIAGLLMQARGLSFRVVNRRLMFWRCLIGAVAVVLYFLALSLIPLGTAVTLQYMSPIFVALFSWVTIRERVPGSTVGLILVAFAGGAILVAPDLSVLRWGSLAAVGSSCLAGLAYLAVRQLRTTDSPESIVFYFSLATLLLALPALIITDRWPDLLEVGALAGVGATAYGGQILMTRAYQNARAAFVSGFSYSTILFGALLGLLVFGEPFTLRFGLGASLIVGAGVILTIRGRTPQHVAPKAVAETQRAETQRAETQRAETT